MKRDTRNSIRLALVLILTFIYSESIGQVVVRGQDCAIRGKQYYYNIDFNSSESSDYKIVLVGGYFDSVAIRSVIVASSSVVNVTWDSTGVCNILIVKGADTLGKRVFVAAEISAGFVSENDIQQVWSKDKSSYLFHCSEASGGHCDPVFTYQWQISSDGLSWSNIQNAQGRDLLFDGTSIVGSVQIRRFSLELKSRSFGYSDIAMFIKNTD